MKNVFLILCTAATMLALEALAAQKTPTPVPRTKFEVPETVKPPAPARVVWNETSACAIELNKRNVDFSVLPRITGANGCAVAEPVELNTLASGVTLSAPAVLDCPTALQFVQFIKTVVQDNAQSILGTSITNIGQASAYVCRTRNGSVKLSEHAFGRAIDIGSFTTASGKTITVMEMSDHQSPEARFLDAVRKAACGPFKTVLGPGSDADHALHFHFDMALRKGKAYCVNAAAKRTNTLRPMLTKDSLLSDIFNPSLRVDPCAAPYFLACALPQHSPPAPPKP